MLRLFYIYVTSWAIVHSGVNTNSFCRCACIFQLAGFFSVNTDIFQLQLLVFYHHLLSRRYQF